MRRVSFYLLQQTKKNNGLIEKLFNETQLDFQNRIKTINWNKYHLTDTFKKGSMALYKWSPIADDLKVLDKKIVINSIKLKWNLVENEFKELTKNLSFNQFFVQSIFN